MSELWVVAAFTAGAMVSWFGAGLVVRKYARAQTDWLIEEAKKQLAQGTKLLKLQEEMNDRHQYVQALTQRLEHRIRLHAKQTHTTVDQIKKDRGWAE